MSTSQAPSSTSFLEQDAAYEFPYHYIAHFQEGTGVGVVQRSLGWGFEYIGVKRRSLDRGRR